MAITTSLIMQKLSGHLGKEVVFKQYGDKTVVTKYPDMSRRVLSKKQLRINEIMQEANYAAKSTLASEVLRNAAQVRLNTTRSRLYTALIKEYFKNAMAETKTPENTIN
ncbi:MAG TPA: hypothetical protein VII28_07160 [Puia sp.]